MADCWKLAILLCGIISAAECSCSDGWMRHGSTCYHFSHDKENWLDSMKMCEIIGGSLLEINDESENNFVMGQLVARSATSAYMALTDVVEENVWVWMISNSKITNTNNFTHWDKNQPNNSGGLQNCVTILKSGLWNDDYCYNTHFYICEKQDPAGNEIVG